ncbi:MAG: DNA/RNA nuclease SfsA, partial [Pseudobdellovibrionaceae bacterium]
PEYSISKETRFDFALGNQTFEVEKKSKLAKPKTGPIHLIEVKNVTMLEKRGDSKIALFPDSITERGQKHMRELGEMSQRGFSSEIVYFIQRSDAESFDVADHIDPEYAKIYRTVTKGQVKVSLAYGNFQRDGLSLKIQPLSI